MEIPDLSQEEIIKVNKILDFSRDPLNVKLIKFEAIVTDGNMRKYLGYQILVDKYVCRKKSKSKKGQQKKRVVAEEGVRKSSHVVSQSKPTIKRGTTKVPKKTIPKVMPMVASETVREVGL